MADGDKVQDTLALKGDKKPKRTLSKDHNLKKRQPQKPERGDNVIYVSTKSSNKAFLERCSKLINDGENEVTIYCIGAAIQRGILLVLQLTERHPTFQISCNTHTTELIDDLEPAADEADYEIQKRFNSSLRIKVFRIDPLKSIENKN